jgi:hypothetical protein
MMVSEMRKRLAGMLMFGSVVPRGTNKHVSFRTDGSSAFAANVYFEIGTIDIKLDVSRFILTSQEQQLSNYRIRHPVING